MKKILFIFVLSLYSIQGFASSCPDGSEPIKSISDDGTYFVFNCDSANNIYNTKESESGLSLNKSIFVSDKDLSDFLNLPKEDRINSCGYKGFIPNWREINKDLAPRIKGYNSKMDNDRIVEGQYTRDVHLKYLEASTFAMVSDDEALKEKLFDKLYYWASKDALSATMQCYSNGPQGVLPACEGEWSDPDGQDIAPIKDATVAVETVLSLNYLYKIFYADFKPKDERHKVILGWFKSFYPRIKLANNFYFGNSVGWHFPNISIKHSLNKDYKSLVENMVQGLDESSYPDGSMKDRTTRGSRALWYHSNALGEAFIILEIARIADVKIPASLEKKLLKAAELFNDTFLDHSVIEPWAKKRVRSQASNGRQEFNSNLDSVSFYSSWMQIFQLRYPEHRTAHWLNQELTSKSSSLKSNQVTGVPLGCISKALADSSPESKEKREKELNKTASDLSIYEFDGMNFNLSLKKLDFIEAFPFILERDEKYLQPYQLYKSIIKGRLVNEDFQNSRFETLVFKYSNDVEQKLVINIDDPTLRPFMSHTSPLPKKCGSDVMEWGWLSFIGKTNDQKSAKKQQCIYDYFKEANDEEALKLFLAVLGGTDSILNYLEENVER